MKYIYLRVFFAFLFFFNQTHAQIGGWDPKAEEKARETIQAFQEKDAELKEFFSQAYGYVVFPSVGKAAIGLGGAHGKGTVFQKGGIIGSAKMTQVTIGFLVRMAIPLRGRQHEPIQNLFTLGRCVARHWNDERHIESMGERGIGEDGFSGLDRHGATLGHSLRTGLARASTTVAVAIAAFFGVDGHRRPSYRLPNKDQYS